MLNIKIIDIIKDAYDNITHYTIQDDSGEQRKVTNFELVTALARNQICITNAKLINGIFVLNKNIVSKTGSAPSIQGVTLRNIKTPTGREGVYVSATVYMDGKKLGQWSQDPYGAICDNFLFDTTKLNERIKNYAQICNNTKMSPEEFMSELYVLCDEYKMYTKYLNKGAKHTIIITDTYGYLVYALGTNSINSPDINNQIELYKQQIIQQGFTPVIKVYSSEKDFIK